MTTTPTSVQPMKPSASPASLAANSPAPYGADRCCPCSTRPALDYSLCLRAQIYPTGADIHTAANLLTTYLGEHAQEDFVPDRFKNAESRLRAFVSTMMIAALG
jgi:hypothetical protein